MAPSPPNSRDLIPTPSGVNPDEDSESDTVNVDRLSNLPTELLAMVIGHLPPSFFQQDLGRLTISKRWHSVALPLFLPRMEITPRIMNRMVDTRLAVLDRVLAPFRNSVRGVNIVLEGGDPDLVRLDTPANLFYLHQLLDEYTSITALRLVARWDKREWHADPRQQTGYLFIQSIVILVHLRHLTSLDLDLCGTHVECPLETPFHFCRFVRRLLSKVQTLRLRVRNICHEALWPLEGSPVTLRELTVTLYLGDVSDHNPKLNSSRRCAPRHSAVWASPMDELRARMRALMKRMQGPRRAVIEHIAPNGEMHVWDASTGVCVKDESEKPREFPLWFKTQSRRCCFHENADDWEWDAEAEFGRIPGSESHCGELEELDEADEPNGVGEVEGAVKED